MNTIGKGNYKVFDQILEALQNYVDLNVFDTEAKEEIEGYLDELK